MRPAAFIPFVIACGGGGGESGDDGPPIPACDVTHFAAAPTDFVLPGVGAEAARTPFAQIADSESVIGMLDANRLSVIAYATIGSFATGARARTEPMPGVAYPLVPPVSMTPLRRPAASLDAIHMNAPRPPKLARYQPVC